MKLIVQIPCFNEEETLPQTIRDIPRSIDGVDCVELLVIDDGSSDGTAELARELGVEHVVRHTMNKGLARAFRSGVEACLKAGAEIIVNTDADNQYCGADIPKLIQPILDGNADIVVGNRGARTNPHFSLPKKGLQLLGSALVRRLSQTTVPDAVSGFRAISRQAALQLNIVSSFSYTIEMLIQAGSKRLSVASVPIETNPKTRDSRLFRSIPHFLSRSVATIARMYAMYQPLRVFFVIGMTLVLVGALPIFRFLYFYFAGSGGGHIQSLVLGGVLLVIGFITLLFGMLADLIGFNRQLIEIALQKVTQVELDLGRGADGAAQTKEGKRKFNEDQVRHELAGFRQRGRRAK